VHIWASVEVLYVAYLTTLLCWSSAVIIWCFYSCYSCSRTLPDGHKALVVITMFLTWNDHSVL